MSKGFNLIKNTISKGLVLLVLCGALIFLVNSCNKTVQTPPSEQKYFFRQIPKNGFEQAQFIHQTSDGGYIIIGATKTTGTEYTIYMTKLDAFGNELWTKDNYNMFIPIIISLGVKLQNGNYYISGVVYGTDSEYHYLILNENGDVVTGPNFVAAKYFIEDPCEDAGKYYLGLSRNTQAYANNTLIMSISPNGNKKNTFINNDTFGYYILRLGVYRANEISSLLTKYWVCGELYPKKNQVFIGNSKCYLATLKNDKPEKIKILNQNNDSLGSDVLCAWLALPDTSVLTVLGVNTFYTFEYTQSSTFRLLKHDKDLNEVWSKTYNLNGHTNLIAHIRPCKRGGYLLMGSTVINNTSQQPLLIKIDENGNLLWWRTYNTTFQGRAGDAYENDDGSIIICGYTFAFGNSNQNSDVFVIKTNANGELQ